MRNIVNTVLEYEIGKEDDLDLGVVAIFNEEANELFGLIENSLSARSEGASIATDIKRALHTLKGGARLAGALNLGGFVHLLEDVIASGEPEDDIAKAVQIGCDRVRTILSQMVSEAVAAEQATEVGSKGDEGGSATLMASAHDDSDLVLYRIPASHIGRISTLMNQSRVVREKMRQIRTKTVSDLRNGDDSLNRLRRIVSDIFIEAETKIHAADVQIGNAGQFDSLEFDRFTKLQELTRRLFEAVADVENIFASSLRGFGDIGLALEEEAVLAEEVEIITDGASRTSPKSQAARFRSVVRESAHLVGKQVNVSIEGELQVERKLLDIMVPAIEHVLRNAVAHGVEAPEERAKVGKSEAGSIVISMGMEGNMAVLSIHDDGRGIDRERVRMKAGLPVEATDEQIFGTLFRAGFSTADSVSEVSGRGIGLDVVMESLAKVGGTIQVRSDAGQGSEFRFAMPNNASYVSGIVLSEADYPYMIPNHYVESVEMVATADLEVAEAAGENITVNGMSVRPIWIGELVGLSKQSSTIFSGTRFLPFVIVKGGQFGFYASQSELTDRKLIRAFDRFVPQSSGIFGSISMPDGRSAVVLTPNDKFMQLCVNHLAQVDESAKHRDPLVLVVDDSITVRKITSAILSKHTFRVATAANGFEALNFISTQIPDIILLDIEMPVMDGFQFATTLRGMDDPARKDIPIIIISSRDVAKHREYAISLGVNKYLGKPYKDAELVEIIHQYVTETLQTA